MVLKIIWTVLKAQTELQIMMIIDEYIFLYVENNFQFSFDVT